MRVLFAVDAIFPETVGGSQRHVYDLASGLAELGATVRVVAGVRDGGGPVDGLDVVTYRVDASSRMARYLSVSAGARSAVARELARGRWDVLCLQHPISAVAAATAAGGIPIVSAFHAPADAEYAFRASRRGDPGILRGTVGAALRAAQGYVINRSSVVTALGEYMRDLLVASFPAAAPKVRVIPGGVGTDEFSSGDRDAARLRLGLADARPLFLTVRRLTGRMGVENLLEALPLVLSRLPDARLVVVGDGPLGGHLRARARELGVAGEVLFVGEVPRADLPAYYRAADLFVLPSIDLEGFGLATIEAMACGTPVLGTPVGETPRILGGLDRSLVLDSAEPGAIAAGMVEWGGREEALRDLGRRAREVVVREYGRRDIVRRHLDLLSRVVAEAGHRR